MSRFAWLLVFSLVCDLTFAGKPGQIYALPQCPGDAERIQTVRSAKHLFPSGAQSVESGELLAVVASALVRQGLSSLGERLKATAAERTVDVLHTGDYKLYTISPAKGGNDVDFGTLRIVPATGCLVVMSRSTAKAPKKVSDARTKLVRGYQKILDGESISSENCCESGAAELATWIRRTYGEAELPGLIAVIDVVPSPTRDSLRLEPRFLATDHSIREKRRDTKKRDFTLSFSLSSPAAAAPIEVLLKFETIKVGSPYSRFERTRTGQPLVVSQWTNFLPVTSDERKQYWTAAEASLATIRSARTTFRRLDAEIDVDSNAPRNVAAIRRVGANNCSFGSAHTTVDSILEQAENQLNTIALRTKEHEAIEVPGGSSPDDEKARAKHVAESERLARYSGYWSACRDFYKSFESLSGIMRLNSEDACQKGKAEAFGVHDIRVDIKEFRRRRVAAFLGGVLSDEELQKALAERAAAAVTDDEPSQAELDSEYEKALAEAELAIATYADEPTGAARVAMDTAKRAANRLASGQGRILPYPEVGLWSFERG